MRLTRTSFLAAAAFAGLAAGVVPIGMRGGLITPNASAQNIGQRVVSGTVLDVAGEPMLGATVFLKDLKTKTIRSYTSDVKGHFRFAQVDMAEDHELWAEKTAKKSAVKTVSSWDTRTVFETELRLK